MRFGHDNIQRLSNRPFNTIEEMDKTIINNWNERVADNDDVYIGHLSMILRQKSLISDLTMRYLLFNILDGAQWSTDNITISPDTSRINNGYENHQS